MPGAQSTQHTSGESNQHTGFFFLRLCQAILLWISIAVHSQQSASALCIPQSSVCDPSMGQRQVYEVKAGHLGCAISEMPSAPFMLVSGSYLKDLKLATDLLRSPLVPELTKATAHRHSGQHTQVGKGRAWEPLVDEPQVSRASESSGHLGKDFGSLKGLLLL